jgi:hypothetical protein
MGLKEPTLFVFNVYKIDEHRYLNFNEFMAFCRELDFLTVPLIDPNFSLNDKKFDDLLAMADGLYTNGELREGIVIRPLLERYSEVLKGRCSFKVVSDKFLIKYGE